MANRLAEMILAGLVGPSETITVDAAPGGGVTLSTGAAPATSETPAASPAEPAPMAPAGEA